ncbi:glycine N-acyltransferase-like protein 3 [Branchiostoma lanceolatum]|uniref:glycine N-acyltransferase-like protein 3 n=1 Tax=Branchiostoma lanceolatum TaxID=7740 RepID=UPI0034535087
MVHVLTRPQLEQVSSALGTEMAASPTSSVTRPEMYHIMRHSLEGKLDVRYMFAVDKWPDYTAILGQPNEDTPGRKSVLNFHWNEEEGLRTLLNDGRLIDWAKPFIIKGIPVGGIPIFQKAFEDRGVVAEMGKTYMPFYLHKTVPDIKSVAMDDVTVGPMSPEHCQLIQQTWDYSDMVGEPDAVRNSIRHQLTTFLSSCVTDKQGNPLSWVITDEFGESQFGFTLPEHRRKGYYTLAKRFLIQRCLEEGHFIFAHVVEGNEASLNAHKKLGYVFEETPNCAFFFVTMKEG